MNSPRMSILSVAFLLLAVTLCRSADVAIEVHTDQVVNRVDEKIYGHFLEHIYHSCNGGLWGELIWNRSFEQNELGRWHVDGDRIVQDALATNQRLTFGDVNWSDYEISLEAKKTGGAEGFLVLFRVNSDDKFYWINLAGWGNRTHRIERGLGDGARWSGIGPQVAGSIAVGRWYRVRVRCVGRQFQIFLDDRKVIDFTDDAKALMHGGVGIGTWSTQAQFRNIRVTSLDGKMLFAGIPEVVKRPEVGTHWKFFGSGEAFLLTDGVLNARCYQRIRSRGGEAGIEQGSLAIHKNESYGGSLWARSANATSIKLRLCDGDRVLAEQELQTADSSWRQYKYVLAPRLDAPQAKLQISVALGAQVDIDQVSMMPESWRANGGFRPDLLAAIAGLRPPVIRWPGGCFASAYRWKQGIGPQYKRLPHPREIWDDLDVYSFGTDEFVAMCRRVKAEPLIVVNIGTPAWNKPGHTAEFLQEVCDWIEYCNGAADSKWGRVRAANGHPEPYGVKYWEIDNETWHMGAEQYAAQVNRFAPAMRRIDPTIRLIACGSGGYNQEWNRTVIQIAGKNFDYLSTHHYESPERYANGPSRDERFYRELAKIIQDGPNPKIKIDCSEWNAQSTDWRTGLYCGGILNVFERCGDVFEIGGPALFLRHVSATGWDNAFINFDQQTWFPAPNYVVMKLWRDHYAPLRINTQGDCAPLNLVATKSAAGDHIYLKVVNPTDSAINVQASLTGVKPLSAIMNLVAPGRLDARNTLQQPQQVHVESTAVPLRGTVVRFPLPPLACGVIDIRCQ